MQGKSYISIFPYTVLKGYTSRHVFPLGQQNSRTGAVSEKNGRPEGIRRGRSKGGSPSTPPWDLTVYFLRGSSPHPSPPPPHNNNNKTHMSEAIEVIFEIVKIVQ